MIEQLVQAEGVELRSGDLSLEEVLTKAQDEFGRLAHGGQKIDSTSLADLVKSQVGIGSSMVVERTLRTVRQLGLVSGENKGKFHHYKMEEALAYVAIFWTIKDEFRQNPNDPFNKPWSELVATTREELGEFPDIAVAIVNESEEFLTFGNLKYGGFLRGRVRGRHGRDLSPEEVSRDEVRERVYAWGIDELSDLQDSLSPTIDALKIGKDFELKTAAEIMLHIAHTAGWTAAQEEVDEIEQFRFKGIVANCAELMELSGIDRLGDLEQVAQIVAVNSRTRRFN